MPLMSIEQGPGFITGAEQSEVIQSAHEPDEQEMVETNAQQEVKSGRERAEERKLEPGSDQQEKPRHEPSVQEKEAAQEIEAKVRLELVTLHEYIQALPRRPDGQGPEKDVVEELLKGLPTLRTLAPKPHSDIIHALMNDRRFREANVHDFVEHGLEILSLWIFTRGLAIGADRSLAEAQSTRAELNR